MTIYPFGGETLNCVIPKKKSIRGQGGGVGRRVGDKATTVQVG